MMSYANTARSRLLAGELRTDLYIQIDSMIEEKKANGFKSCEISALENLLTSVHKTSNKLLLNLHAEMCWGGTPRRQRWQEALRQVGGSTHPKTATDFVTQFIYEHMDKLDPVEDTAPPSSSNVVPFPFRSA